MTAYAERIQLIADGEAIGCGLGAGELDGRLDEWRRLSVAAAERTIIPGGIRLSFDSIDRRALADLVEREHECCPFLSFATTLTPSRTTLEMTGPDDAAELLAALI